MASHITGMTIRSLGLFIQIIRLEDSTGSIISFDNNARFLKIHCKI